MRSVYQDFIRLALPMTGLSGLPMTFWYDTTSNSTFVSYVLRLACDNAHSIRVMTGMRYLVANGDNCILCIDGWPNVDGLLNDTFGSNP